MTELLPFAGVGQTWNGEGLVYVCRALAPYGASPETVGFKWCDMSLVCDTSGNLVLSFCCFCFLCKMFLFVCVLFCDKVTLT